MLLEHEGRITLATPQVAVMLGYFGVETAQPTMEQLFDSQAALEVVRHTLVDLGSFEGAVRLRKKMGTWCWWMRWPGFLRSCPRPRYGACNFRGACAEVCRCQTTKRLAR